MKFTSPKNRRSQIAVIITFVIAVIFLFIAVFINLSKVSQVKTTTSTAADKAALSLASQLGSMSHYYKDKVLKISGPCTSAAPCKACKADWVPLAALIGIGVLTGLASFLFAPALPLFLGAAAAAVSTVMLGGISSEFKSMSGYNSMRETALFQALSSVQSDSVELKKKEPGIFYEDNNGNGVFDTGEKVYNLSAMPEMLNQPKVDRFSAWYYTYRLALLRDEDKGIEDAINKFIDGKAVGERDGLKKFIDVDNWSSAILGITDLSYVIAPGTTSANNYDITCSGSSCPGWVKDPDPAKKLLRMVRVNSADAAYGGFLDPSNPPPLHTFKNLLTRLDGSYDGTFCADADCKIKPSDVDNLIEDLREFLLRSKEVINLPVSQRMSSLTQWFLPFYDFKEHKADRTSIDDTATTPDQDFMNIDFNDHYSRDIYLRLIRDQVYINRWIIELEGVNSQVAGVIPLANGHNEFGLGCTASRCATVYCGGYCSGDGCCPTCVNLQPCSFAGIYCSAYGDSTPPVCEHGDLYGTHPSWCLPSGLPNKSADCVSGCSSCSRENNSPKACDFQGTLFYTTPPDCNIGNTTTPSGQTEVEQALKILRALYFDLSLIKFNISGLADKVESMTTSTSVSPFRNEIIYAWKDKPKPDGGKQFSHLAQVKIEGYPIKLPYVSESIEWGGLQKCRTLNNYEGNFKITTLRYDQDQPTDIGKTDIGGWQLRRRKMQKVDDVTADELNAIVADVQDNGTINTTQAGIDDILTNYAITSCSKAHYGPEKSNIYITGTQCD